MTVLPDAPIDPATGLPVPTIAVATAGGVSVIKDDGTVIDVTDTRSFSVHITAVNRLVVHGGGANSSYPELITAELPYDDTTFSAISNLVFRTRGINEFSLDQAGGVTKAGPLVSTSRKGDIALSQGQPVAPLYRAYEDIESAANSLFNITTTTYNTGWMPGDIKGAFLSDTDDTDLVGGELVTNGTFDTDLTGWTGDAIYDAGTAKLDYDAVGTNAYLQQTVTGLTAGKRYIVTWSQTLSGTGTQRTRRRFRNAQNNGDLSFGYNNGSGEFSIIITADGDQFLFNLWVENAGTVANVDDVSVKLADADRSVNNNGLIVNGTITRTPVATGADLVAYSGFSSSNYLTQPYNPDLDFGTGDFCIMGWGKQSAGFAPYMRGNNLSSNPYDKTNSSLALFCTSTGNVGVFINNSAKIYAPNGSVNSSKWTHIAALRKSGVIYMYIDGALTGSVADTTDLTDVNAVTRIGTTTVGSALWRVSATAPTAEQIAKIYEDEKFLFQENAQATLYGTSDAVTALAHDPVTDLLHVGTSDGRSVFQGLRRVDNTTDAVSTAISASNNLIVEQ